MHRMCEKKKAKADIEIMSAAACGNASGMVRRSEIMHLTRASRRSDVKSGNSGLCAIVTAGVIYSYLCAMP